MTSKTCHDVRKVFITSNTRHDVNKNHPDVPNIFEPILHFYDVPSQRYQRLCVFHKFGDFTIRPIPVISLDNVGIIPKICPYIILWQSWMTHICDIWCMYRFWRAYWWLFCFGCCLRSVTCSSHDDACMMRGRCWHHHLASASLCGTLESGHLNE